MKELGIGGALGLFLGWIFQRAGLACPDTLREALGMRRRGLWRMTLVALGTATLGVAFLGWLAVLDVDHLVIAPLNAGVVLGSLLLGAAMGFTGYTPGGILTGVGGGKPLAGVCALAGGVAGAVCCRLAAEALAGINGWFPAAEGTLFRTTLHAPYLLKGGFMLHGAVGLTLLAVGLCISREREKAPPQAAGESETPVRSADAAAESPPSPEDAAAETVVAALPQEETWTMDTVPVALPEQTAETLAGNPAPEAGAEPPAPSLPEETVAEDRATLARAGKTPMASATMPAAEPTPVIRPAQPSEKSDRTH